MRTSIKTTMVLSTLLILTCCAKSLYVFVPDSNVYLFDWPYYNLQPFTCIDCPKKYDAFIEEEIYLKNNRLQWNPLSEKELTNTNYLLTVHNTLKQVGYKTFLSEALYREKFSTFVDSLLVWEPLATDTTNYYYKFWQRRKSQRNNQVILNILKEVKSIYNDEATTVDAAFVDKELLQTIDLDKQMAYSEYNHPKVFFPTVFECLKRQGKYAEAYTLLHRPVDFKELGYDKIEWMKSLPIDSVRCAFMDYNDSTTVLGYFDKAGTWHDEHIYWLDYPGP